MLDKWLGVASDLVSGAERCSVAQDGATDRLKVLDLAAVNDEETFRDERSHRHREQGAIARSSVWRGAFELVIRQLAEALQLFENFADRRRGQIVDAKLFQEVIVLQEFLGNRGGLCVEGRGGCNEAEGQETAVNIGVSDCSADWMCWPLVSVDSL